MRHYFKLISRLALCLSLCAFLLAGCAEEEVYVPVTSNTIEVTQEGRLIAYIVEDFEKDYYDIDELADMVRTEIAAYNKEKASLSTDAGQVPVQVDKVMMAEDGSAKAVVALNFQNAAVYEDYMGMELFYGTVSEAMTAGYKLEGMLFDAKKGTVLPADKLERNEDRTILIIEDSVVIRPDKKVLYLSENTSLTEQGYVDAAEGEGFKYIITK